MTRINTHTVIQLVGDDTLVFMDDDTGAEVTFPIRVAEGLLERFAADADRGNAFGVIDPDSGAAVAFLPAEYNAVENAIDYLMQCSTVPIEEQLRDIKVVAFDSPEDWLKWMEEHRG